MTRTSAEEGRRIAIAYDCAYPFVPGGGQKRLFEICRRLVKMGWRIDWYALHSWPEEGETEVEGIRFIPAAPSTALYGGDGKRSILQTLYYGRAMVKFPRLGGYDLIHMGQWPYFHFFPARLYSWFGGARVSADWWEVWARHWLEYYGRKGLLGIVLERLCARLPSQLVAISETGARQLQEIGVSPKRIRVIHNGIDWNRIRGTRAAGETGDVVYLGRLQPHKNVDLLIRALGLLRDRGQSASLTIIGDGPERDALEAMTDALNLRAQVRFLGPVAEDDEVYALLKASRLFVHPSTKEGGGSITSLEANAAGLPVVAFRHPGGISPELIEEGVNGHWVDEVDAEALAKGIAHGLELAAQDGAAARCEQFAKPFDWDALALQYDALFRERLKRK